MPGMRWITGGALLPAIALTVAGSPAVAAAPSPGGNDQAASRSMALDGSARPAFNRPPVATALADVSCRSVSLCLAVGLTGIFREQPARLATDIWNGRSWHGLATPTPVGALSLSAVSCASRAACMATGSARTSGISHSFAESWDGRAWTTLATAPAQDTLSGISCPAPALCMAVGHTGPPAEQNPSPAA